MHTSNSKKTPSLPCRSKCKRWRHDAAHIVEELFRVTGTEHWNALLDLRERLLSGSDWEATLNCFLHCRELMESDHYLPFYRLRKLICSSLKLEIDEKNPEFPIACLAKALRKRHRSLADIRRAVSRELYEHDLGVETPGDVRLRLVERI